MIVKTLKLNNTILNKKTFHNLKEPIESVNVDHIVVSDKFKHNNEGILSILLVTKKNLLNHYALFYLK